MDTAPLDPTATPEPDITHPAGPDCGLPVESLLHPGLSITEAEIDAILRLLGDDLARLLR